MKTNVLSAVLGLSLVWPAAISAQSIYLRELVVISVRQIDANSFEVIESSGAGGTQLWCAAAKFTRDNLRQRGGDISVLEARGPSAAFPGRKSVIFTTAGVANPVKSTSQGVRTEGQTFTMAHAYALCRSQPEYLIKVRVVGS